MADQHIGYPGSVNSIQLADWLPNVASAQYSVEGLNDGQVFTNNIGDRGVTVRAGTVIGDGIMDIFETDVNLNFPAVLSGPDRWDMVVLRRTWNATPGASTSVYTIIQGGPNKTLPVRETAKGVKSDQPMALCRIKAGDAGVKEIIDLRCWAHNGGVQAVSELVKEYLTQPGTQLNINGEQWIKAVNETGTADYWEQISQLGSIQLGGIGFSMGGGTPGPNTPFFIQAGTKVNTTDGGGYSTIVWPKPFPNGLLTVVALNGDDWATSGNTFFASSGNERFHGTAAYGNKTSWTYVVLTQDRNTNQVGRAPANIVHRINYVAIGW